MMIKKLFILFICLSFFLIPIKINAANDNKVINVVYDDSVSMVKDDDDNYLKTWSQAKYAMESFVAMLDQNDILNIFEMSRNKETGANHKVVINGSTPASQRVQTVHEINTTQASGTPFSSVINAYQDLIKQQGEKWLVILTDGEFQNVPAAGIENTLKQYTNEGIKVVYLSIGNLTNSFQSSDNFYVEHATDGDDILNKVTAISNNIFQRNILPEAYFDAETGKIKFDVSMKKIIVYIQGENVKINKLTAKDVKIKKQDAAEIKCSEVIPLASSGSIDASKVIKDDSLKGVIATFMADNDETTSLPKGEYILDVPKNKKVAIYYEPDVTIGVNLFKDGKELVEGDEIEAGKYTIKGYCKDNVTGKISESELLGNFKIDAVIENNGNKIEPDQDGYYYLEKGTANINAKGKYLNYHNLNINRNLQITPKKIPLKLNLEKESYQLKSLSKKDKSMLLTVTYDNQLLTEKQWLEMALPQIKTDEQVKFKVTRGQEVSTFEIIPLNYNQDYNNTSTGEIEFTINASSKIDDYLAKGTKTAKININDNRSLIEKITNFIKKHWLLLSILLALFILWWCYIYKKAWGPYKPWLAKKKRIHPTVALTKKDHINVKEPDWYKCKTKVKHLYTPCKAVEVDIKICHPNCYGNVPPLKLQATKKLNTFIVLNRQEFEDPKILKGLSDFSAKKIHTSGQYTYRHEEMKSKKKSIEKQYTFKFFK